MKLGVDPINLPVVLVTGADFKDFLTYTVDGVATNWPASTHIYLWFEDTTITPWEATIATSTATWDVDKAVADTVANGTEARILYVNGTDDQTLSIGQVERR